MADTCHPSSDIIFVFVFNDTATTDIYTLSLHGSLPISGRPLLHHRARRQRGANQGDANHVPIAANAGSQPGQRGGPDRKSTRLNSSHANISYAVFCLKKKNAIVRGKQDHKTRSTTPLYT